MWDTAGAISAGRKLRAVREGANTSTSQAAAFAGVSDAEYRDLEEHGDLFSAISLRCIGMLCKGLKISVTELLLGEKEKPCKSKTFDDLAQEVRRQASMRGCSVEALEDVFGWELTTFILNPDVAFEWNVDELVDISEGVGDDPRTYLNYLNQI